MYYKVSKAEYDKFLLETGQEHHDDFGVYQRYKGEIVSVEDRGPDVLLFDYFGPPKEEVKEPKKRGRKKK